MYIHAHTYYHITRINGVGRGEWGERVYVCTCTSSTRILAHLVHIYTHDLVHMYT